MDKNQPKTENLLADQIQLLSKTDPSFPHKLKRRLCDESHQVTNPFKFVAGLFSKGILCDGTDNKANQVFGLENLMVKLAVDIACSNGADAIVGLLETLEESGNLHVSAAIRAWCEENFALQADSGCSEPEGSGSVVPTPASTILPEGIKYVSWKRKFSAVGRTEEKPDIARLVASFQCQAGFGGQKH